MGFVGLGSALFVVAAELVVRIGDATRACAMSFLLRRWLLAAKKNDVVVSDHARQLVPRASSKESNIGTTVSSMPAVWTPTPLPPLHGQVGSSETIAPPAIREDAFRSIRTSSRFEREDVQNLLILAVAGSLRIGLNES